MCNCDRNVKQKTCWQRRAVVNVSKDRNKLTLPPSSYIIQAAARHKKCHRKDLHQVKQKIIAVLALSQVDLLRLVTVYCLVPCLNVTRQSDSEWGRMSEKTKCNDNKNRGFLCAFFFHLSNTFSGLPDVQITVKRIQTSRCAPLALGGPQMPRLRPIRFHHHDVLRFQCGSNGLTTVYQLWSFTALLKK